MFRERQRTANNKIDNAFYITYSSLVFFYNKYITENENMSIINNIYLHFIYIFVENSLFCLYRIAAYVILIVTNFLVCNYLEVKALVYLGVFLNVENLSALITLNFR